MTRRRTTKKWEDFGRERFILEPAPCPPGSFLYTLMAHRAPANSFLLIHAQRDRDGAGALAFVILDPVSQSLSVDIPLVLAERGGWGRIKLRCYAMRFASCISCRSDPARRVMCKGVQDDPSDVGESAASDQGRKTKRSMTRKNPCQRPSHIDIPSGRASSPESISNKSPSIYIETGLWRGMSAFQRPVRS